MADEPPRSPEKNSNNTEGNQDLWKYVSLGTQLTISVGLFVLLGWWIDRHFGWSPWGTTVLGMLGICAAMYVFLKDSLR